MRANSSEGCGKRNLIFDQFQSLVELAVSDESYIALAVGVAGTCDNARRTAITCVVGEQEFQVGLSGLDNSLSLGINYHSGSDLCSTCFAKLGVTLYFAHAETAGTVDLGSFVIAKSRNKNVIFLSDFQNSLTGESGYFFAVNVK